jgi:predicted DNA-binding antitoxin AbrB/MazE fold protein
MNTVHAVFENGVFRPLGQVDLPEHTEVEFEPRPATMDPGLKKIYETLSLRFRSGEHDVAARHNEHQP